MAGLKRLAEHTRDSSECTHPALRLWLRSQSSRSTLSSGSSSALRPSATDSDRRLPKAELHAHLNGCIPLNTLRELAEATPSSSLYQDDLIERGLETLRAGVQLDSLDNFFALFPAIYALTSTPHATRLAARAVLGQFLEPGYLQPDDPPQCEYLELRTTPRANENMTREEYLSAVLDEVEAYPSGKAALLVSVDRRMSEEDAISVVEIAIKLREQGRRVVGIDLCGTPSVSRSYRAVSSTYSFRQVGNAGSWLPAFELARDNGLQLTLHIAEVRSSRISASFPFLTFRIDSDEHPG